MAEETTRETLLTDAVRHLEQAIALLDRAGVPGHIAAHVDLAVNQVVDLVPGARRSSTVIGPDPHGFGSVEPF